MAIVEMKRINLLAMRQDQRKLLKAMQHMGCVEVSAIKGEEAEAYRVKDSAKLEQVEDTMNRLTWVMGMLGRYNKQKAPFMGNRPEAPEEEVRYIGTHEGELMALLDQADSLEKRSGEMKGQLARIAATQEQLSPWLKLDIPVERISSTKDVFQQAGTMNKSAVQALVQKWSGQPVCLEVLEEVRESAYVWVAAYASVRDEFLADLKTAGYAPQSFGEGRGLISDQYNALTAETENIRKAQAALEDEWKAMAEKLTRLKTWSDMLQVERDRLEAAGRTVGTSSVFLLRGWVPAALADKVQAELEKLSPTAAVEISTPDEDDLPPVQLHNNKYVAPFESIIEGFALPAPGSIDPTAVMAPFYALLFGMMLSDAGYGLVMAIAIPLLVKLKKPGKSNQKLLWVLFFSAIATVLCGAVYNTWFGFNLPIKGILDPIKDPMPVMIVCMGIGVIHLFAGLGVGAYANIRKGKPMDAVYDQLSWMLAVSGAIMLVAGGVVAEIGKWMAIAGVALIVLFAGREKKNPFARLAGGLGALYGATSWISDILSYMRLFGMGLATGVIGMVINKLVGMVFAGGIVGMIIGSVLFVGAHIFNLGINALGAYVHSCRLQYIEFFGKFYEEGGVAFRPLQYNTRFVNFKEV